MAKKSRCSVVLLLLFIYLLAGCIEKEEKEISTPIPTPVPTSSIIPTPIPTISISTPIPTVVNNINLSKEKKINLSRDYNGWQIELTKGQNLNLTLEANPSTGYSWEIVEINNSILHRIGEEEYKQDPRYTYGPLITGVPELVTFKFEVINTGKTSLKLVYHQVWMKDVAPVNTFSIDIVVR